MPREEMRYTEAYICSRIQTGWIRGSLETSLFSQKTVQSPHSIVRRNYCPATRNGPRNHRKYIHRLPIAVKLVSLVT